MNARPYDSGVFDIALPATERVDDIGAVEKELIFERIHGKRNWAELVQGFYGEEYPNRRELGFVVQVSMEKIKEGEVPRKIMEAFRETQALNEAYALK